MFLFLFFTFFFDLEIACFSFSNSCLEPITFSWLFSDLLKGLEQGIQDFLPAGTFQVLFRAFFEEGKKINVHF